MESPKIVFSANNSYIPYLLVALRTLGRNNKYPINIYLLYTNLTKKNLLQLKLVCDNFNYNFTSIKINKSLFEGAREMRYLKLETYYRLIIPTLIDSKSVLYLDCDILIKSNIKELFDIDLRGYALAAVKDAVVYQPIDKNKMNNTSNYFNTGILLMNLDYWRQNNLSKIILDFAIENHNLLLFADQCAINAIIGLDYISLNKEYNFQPHHIIKDDEKNLFELNNCKIVHFCGAYKPTHHLNNNPYKELYLNELKFNPGYDLFITKHTFLNFISITFIEFKNVLKWLIFYKQIKKYLSRR